MKKKNTFLFKKINYQIMIIGIILIIIGFLLMLGYDANTNNQGNFDPNYWNNDIFSFRRIRLAPFFIVIGFLVEVISIFYKDKKNNNN